MSIEDYSIVIMSCDSYADAWDPLKRSFELFWKDCPFPIYLCSEEEKFEHPWIQNIRVGRKAKWGDMLHYVLDEINTKHIIYLQEDYLLKGFTNEKELFRLLSIYESSNAAYLRLLPWPKADVTHTDYSEVGICLPDSKYRTSLQAAVWDRLVLQGLVHKGDDGRFESWSIGRAKHIERQFLCVTSKSDNPNINQHPPYAIDYYATGIFQGKWLKECLKIMKSRGVFIDSSVRGCMNRWDFLKLKLKRLIN